jgi:hypothetical protein
VKGRILECTNICKKQFTLFEYANWVLGNFGYLGHFKHIVLERGNFVKKCRGTQLWNFHIYYERLSYF